MSKLNIEGKEIRIYQGEYFSLTDMVKENPAPYQVIANWMRRGDTLDFLFFWESENNPDFKPIGFDGIKDEIGRNTFTMTPQRWQELVNAKGIYSKRGRYGGIYAHLDIAIDFAYNISPVFRYQLIREFERLKEDESSRLGSPWSYSRFLSKVNHQLHTEAIKTFIVPRIGKGESYVFASEADMLNVAVFGIKAREWRESNPAAAKKGNIRDHATTAELTVLANLESLNSFLIERGASQHARFEALASAAISQLEVLRRGLMEGEE